MKKRIIFDIVVLALVFYAPWWLTLATLFVGAYVWTSYYEIILFGILLDVLYGSNSMPLRGTIGTVSALVIYFATNYFRKIVR